MESLYEHIREPLQMILYDTKAIINMITREEDCQNENAKMINDCNRFFGIVNVYLSSQLFADGSIQVQPNPHLKIETRKFYLHSLINACNTFRSYLCKFIQSSKCIDISNTKTTIYNLVKSNLNSMVPLLLESSRKIIKVLKSTNSEDTDDQTITQISSKFITQMKTITEYCCEPVTLSRDTFEYMKNQLAISWQQFLGLMNDCLLEISVETQTLGKSVTHLMDDLGMVLELTLRSFSQPSVNIEILAMKADVDKCIMEIVETIRLVYPLLSQSMRKSLATDIDSFQFQIPLITGSDDDDLSDDHNSLASGSNSNRSSIISIDNSSMKHSSSNLEAYFSNSVGANTPSITRIDSIPKSTSLNDMNNSNATNKSSSNDLNIIISLDSDDEDEEDKPTIWSLPISTVSGDPFQKNKVTPNPVADDKKQGSEKKKWYKRIILKSSGKDKDTLGKELNNSTPPMNGNSASAPNLASSLSKGNSKSVNSNSFSLNSLGNINPGTNSSSGSGFINPMSSNSSTPSYSSPVIQSRPSTPSITTVDQLLISASTNGSAIPMVEITSCPLPNGAGLSSPQRITKTDSFLNLANSIVHISEGDDDFDDYENSIDFNDTPVGFRGSVQERYVALFEPYKDFTIEEVGESSKRFQASWKSSQTINISFENNERHITHYESYFYGQDHYNFVGNVPELGGNIIVSIKKEVDVINGQDKRHRVLIITKNSTEKILLKSSSSKEGDLQKAILSYLKPIVKLSSSSLKNVKTDSLQTKLLQFEKNNIKKQYHYFLLFAGDVQTTQAQMLGNENVSKEFVDFYKFLGKTFQTKNWNKYSGGLDITHNMDAVSAIHTEINDIEIVFHVSHMFQSPSKRREFLSKSNVVLVYHEGNKPLNLSTFDLQNNQVFFEIRKVKIDDGSQIHYKLGSVHHNSIPPFGPMLPDPAIFKKDFYFKQYLLTKLINATNSTLTCPLLTKDLLKNREIELNNIISRRPNHH